VASRCWKARSMSSSMVLRARPSWPTSPAPPAGLTRCDRSPAVIDRAVPAMSSNARSPRRRMSHDPTESSNSRMTDPPVSSRIRRCNRLVTSVNGAAITTVSPAPPCSNGAPGPPVPGAPPVAAGTVPTSTRKPPEPVVDTTVNSLGALSAGGSGDGSLGVASDRLNELMRVPVLLSSSA
jgi:hypothetical protein